VPAGLEGSDTALTWATSEQTVYQTVYKKRYTLYNIPTVITKVQLTNLMSKVPNRFRHDNTLGERIPHIDNAFGEGMTVRYRWDTGFV